MTMIQFRFNDSYHSPATGTVVFHPHRRHAANETEVLPKPFHHTLQSGELTVDLEATAPTWVWSATHKDTTLFYSVPDQDGVIPHTDLIPIAPSTLPTPNNAVEPAWWAEIRQYIRLFTDTIARANDAVEIAEESALTASQDASTSRHQASLSDGYMRQSRQYSYDSHDSAQHSEQQADRAEREADRIPLDWHDTYYRGHIGSEWDVDDLVGLDRVGQYNVSQYVVNLPVDRPGTLLVEYIAEGPRTRQTYRVYNVDPSANYEYTRIYTRDDEWTEWEVTGKTKIAIGSNDNLNNYVADGSYVLRLGSEQSDILNTPPTAPITPFILDVVELNDSITHQTYVTGTSGTPKTFRRYRFGDTWNEWQTQSTAPSYTPAQSDLNEYTQNGVYTLLLGGSAPTINNRPPSAFNQPFVLTVTETNPSITHQEFVSGQGGEIQVFRRYRFNNTWNDWHSVYTDQQNNDTTPLESINRHRVTLYGDSQVDGSAYTQGFSSTLPYAAVSNRGRSGDSADQVALRAGVKTMSFRPVTGVIPETGTVEVETSAIIDTARERIFGGSLSGIAGTLRHNTDHTWSFTRSGTGTAKTVNEPVVFLSNESLPHDVIVAQFGGNNTWEGGVYLAPSRGDHVKTIYQQFYDRCSNHKNILFPGVTYGVDSEPGEIRHDLTREVNTWLADTYPQNFFNLNSWLIEHGLDTVGITPTPEDTAAVDAGRMPPSLLADNVHFTPEAYTAISTELARQLQRRGWVD